MRVYVCVFLCVRVLVCVCVCVCRRYTYLEDSGQTMSSVVVVDYGDLLALLAARKKCCSKLQNASKYQDIFTFGAAFWFGQDIWTLGGFASLW